MEQHTYLVIDLKSFYASVELSLIHISLRYSLKSCMKGLRQGALPGEDYEEAGRVL